MFCVVDTSKPFLLCAEALIEYVMSYWPSSSLFLRPDHLNPDSSLEFTDGGSSVMNGDWVWAWISSKLNRNGIFTTPSSVLKSDRAVLSKTTPRN